MQLTHIQLLKVKVDAKIHFYFFFICGIIVLVMNMIMNGKLVREEKVKDLKYRISKLDKKLSLVVIEVGDDEASKVYIKQKEKLALELGINFIVRKFRSAACESEIINAINEYNLDDNINGIMLQLPLPKQLDEFKLINYIDPNKDVDGLTSLNLGKLFQGSECLSSCTASGIVDLLDYYGVDLSGKNVVIINRSIVIGKPLAMMLVDRNATVTVCHSKTREIKSFTKTADIVITGVGKPNFLTKDMVKEGVIVIDAGITRFNGKVAGDVCFDEVKDKSLYITPVPGGVGVMTVYELCENLYKTLRLK